ncbi:beta/gamma crystallin-related protein [Sphingopyxis sp. HXXIV]|uniref:beta/gamma crystallin-related protein n=1 Tax=Sphingopyxis sp. HXXIV TaxID=1759075 RepID=UPI0007375699|nr:beta/gamma crystallin-related protein [Sphingopyxis sp. HXXIV]KTE85729.1 hypothetical protein ATE72_01845 [Sphingopyxis sp. HXXIV]
MKAVHRLSIAGALAASLTGGLLAVSAAQTPEDRLYRPPEATIYRDAGYRGPAVFVGEAKTNLGLAWPVNSVRVASGRWELCERTRYRGQCRTVDRDTPMLGSVLRGMTVQSMRPVGGGGGGGWQPPIANDQVARGNFAEFHTQPSTSRYFHMLARRPVPAGGAQCRQLVPRRRLERVGARAYGNGQRPRLSRRRSLRPVGLLRQR